MFHDVGDSGAVGRRRAEGNAKDFVVVFAGKIEQRCAGLFVLEHVCDGFNFLDGFCPLERPVFVGRTVIDLRGHSLCVCESG